MNQYVNQAWTRRQFLHNGLVVASTAATMPMFLQRSALALAGPDNPTQTHSADERVLVVLQLSGGNDGLNTVVPFGTGAYYTARRNIAIPQRDALVMDQREGLGLHPAMGEFKSLFDDGLVSVVQGVGYPNPDRSHFTSMDVWHTASTDVQREGWLGRYFDARCAGSPGKDARRKNESMNHAGIVLNRRSPLAMQGKAYRPVAFEDPRLLQWTGAEESPALAGAHEQLLHEAAHAASQDSAAAFLTRTALDAQVSSEKIRAAVAARPGENYPRSALGQQLAMVASMVHSGLSTRVYYVSMGGFDTHAAQGSGQGQHANLLRQFSQAMNVFYRDLKAQGNDSRVMTMVFSEFGRRVAQNASNGTDHGAAAPMFLVGPMVRAGILGNHPSMTDLDDGDLKFGVDFRSVYATLLEKWLGADADVVLGTRFPRANVLHRA